MELILIIVFLYFVRIIVRSGNGGSHSSGSGLSDWEKEYTLERMRDRDHKG